MGSADLSAASALLRSPDLIASSTLRTSDFTRVRRPLLTSVRVIIWRAAFFADDVLAMKRSLYCLKMPLAHLKGEPRPLVERKHFRAGRSVQARFAGGIAVRRRSVNEATAKQNGNSAFAASGKVPSRLLSVARACRTADLGRVCDNGEPERCHRLWDRCWHWRRPSAPRCWLRRHI